MEFIVKSRDTNEYQKIDITTSKWSGWKNTVELAIQATCSATTERNYKNNIVKFLKHKQSIPQRILYVYTEDIKYSLNQFKDLYPEYFI